MNADKLRLLPDTNVIIDALNDTLDLSALLDTLGDCELYTNPIVTIEVLAKANMSEKEETSARALLDSFIWTDIDKAVCEAALRIRREARLKLPDALIAASAIILNATVLSNDAQRTT